MKEEQTVKDTYTSTVTALVEQAEALGWSCYVALEYSSIKFTQDSPAGENFSFCVNGETAEEIVANIREYAEGFNIEVHVKKWLDAKACGAANIPPLDDLVANAKAIRDMLNRLAQDTTGCNKKSVLREKISQAKAEYLERYGVLDWKWIDEGLPYTILDYHGSRGSLMDFTEDDWLVCKENGWTLDEVCKLCDEQRFCEDVDNLESYIQEVRDDHLSVGTVNEFLELSRQDAIALVEDFYTWREKLFPVVKKVYSSG